MAKEVAVRGYECFRNAVENLESSHKTINIYFTGTKDEKGKSWCPDCVTAEPYIKEAVKLSPEDSVFLYVEVGDRSSWKDMKCKFRLDKETHLSVIPTLLRWKNPQKLEGAQCENADLLKMYFTDD